MRDYGALGAMMSGSGPTVFGLLPIQGRPRQPMRTCGFGKASELAKQVYLTNFFNVKRNGQDRSIMQERGILKWKIILRLI